MHHAIWFYINVVVFGILAIETGIFSCIYGIQTWQSIDYGYFKQVWYTPILLIVHMFISMFATMLFFYELGEW